MDIAQEIIPYGNCNQVVPDFADQLPPGYRFCPTDSELIQYYLNAKIESRELPKCRLHEVNIYNHKPEELAERYRSSENNWYFLTPRDRKYAKGNRPSRAVRKFGFWKTTQKHKPVHDHATRQMVGYKGTLTFFDMNKKKTMWLMQEFTTNGPNLPFGRGENNNKLNEWVLCKIYKNETNQSTNSPGAGEFRNTTNQDEVMEEQSRTDEGRLPKRLRASETHENNFTNHHEHVEVQEANQQLGRHIQMVAQLTAPMGYAQTWVNQGVGYKNGGTVGETRMNTRPYPIPMQPTYTFQDSHSIQPAPCSHNQFTSDASNGFEYSDGASSSVSMEPPATVAQPLDDNGAYITPTVHGLDSIQPAQREFYQNMLSSTACNGRQFSNDALNSSSTQPAPEAAAQQPLDYGGYTTQSLANYDALQQNVHYDVHQQHLQHSQMLYQDPQSQLQVQNGAVQDMVVPQDVSDHIPQPDVYDASISLTDIDEWSLDDDLELESCFRSLDDTDEWSLDDDLELESCFRPLADTDEWSLDDDLELESCFKSLGDTDEWSLDDDLELESCFRLFEE